MITMPVRLGRALSVAILTCSVAGLSACGDSPVDVVFEVIEETTFAPSLNIDLAAMQKLGNGVYIQNLAVGGGTEVVFGATVSIDFTMWLTDGTEVQTGTEEFLMGNNAVVSGVEDGIVGARVGGTRLIVVPPNHGYGSQDLLDEITGLVTVPAGSVLVFEVTILEVNQPAF